MKVVVGLGNPGRQYEQTRHNIGFMVLDYLASAPHVSGWRSRFQGLVTETSEASQPVLLVKPETFMNLSGRCVRQVVDFYKLAASDVLIICDDIALPLGKLRVKASGSSGGQNGLKSIEQSLGTQNFARLRVGVGQPSEYQDAAEYVLSRFKPGELATVEDAIARSAQAVMIWVREGIEACMNKTNGPPVAKKEKKDKPKSEGEKPKKNEEVENRSSTTPSTEPKINPTN
ncbi:MAG: aminoacyl-tRNA hydrolase [Gemmataceae bacterium]|jgi:PTH1 family peptidyl-tRNA hydrolase|nr:aminoacyl-tRNA hydrolase [Gemmataceae bacterium]